MTRESEWREEWEEIRAERARARACWRDAADGLAARARDPFGLRRLVSGHPVALAGIGAGLAAVVVKFLMRKAPAPPAAPAPPPTPRPEGDLSQMLRDLSLTVAMPWVMRWVKEHFGQDVGTIAATDAATGPRPREVAVPGVGAASADG